MRKLYWSAVAAALSLGMFGGVALAGEISLNVLGQPIATGLIQKNKEQPFFENFSKNVGFRGKVTSWEAAAATALQYNFLICQTPLNECDGCSEISGYAVNRCYVAKGLAQSRMQEREIPVHRQFAPDED